MAASLVPVQAHIVLLSHSNIVYELTAIYFCFQFILEELILENTFNQGGAEQLHFDIARNLTPLFSKYTTKPEQYFRSLEEACAILIEARIPPHLKLTALKKDEAETILLQRLH